jgi:predicted nucleic acid-binding protein
MNRKPIIYLDTNIIRDCFSGRNKQSLVILREFKKSKLRCITSTFSKMELYDTERENKFFISGIRRGYEFTSLISKRKNINLTRNQLEKISDSIDNFFKKYKFIEIWDIEKDYEWEVAEMISASTNISAADAIHLTIAIVVGVNLIITNDSGFSKEAEHFLRSLDLWDIIRVSDIPHAIDTLEEMGFKSNNIIKTE